MGHEHLMRQLPKDVENSTTEGPIKLRKNGGSWSLVLNNPVIVTIGGSNSKAEADEAASAMNQAYQEILEKQAQARTLRHQATKKA